MTKTRSSKRLFEIDVLRALAIVLMVFTHVAIYFYNYSNPLFSNLADFGGWVCFSIFLFDSAAALPISYARHGAAHLRKSLLRRAILFYFLYLFVGILYSPIHTTGEFIPTFISIALLQSIPIFADFILAFVAFFLVGWLVSFILANPRRLIFVWIASWGTLILGYYLSFIEISQKVAPYSSIFVGHPEIHRFPIAQYLLIFMSGILFTVLHSQLEKHTNAFMTLCFFLAVSFIALQTTGFERWQTSPGFILFGLSFIVLLLALGNLTRRVFVNMHQLIDEPIIFISKDAIGVLIVHLFVLWALEMAFHYSFTALTTIVITIIVFTLSLFWGRWVKL